MSRFLTFLPMLPTQILLNNLLYDTSQLAIPTDTVSGADWWWRTTLRKLALSPEVAGRERPVWWIRGGGGRLAQ
ncbi:MAG: hypothetical protein LC749_21230, partial [Actinobacteria bacterium]|nr:hypothetical protein [Actinomycetota bacterium]